MKKITYFLGTTILLLMVESELSAQVSENDHSGFYVDFRTGISAASGLDVKNSDNDVPTRYDGFLGQNPGDWEDPKREKWETAFDGALGVFGSARIGYNLPWKPNDFVNLRAELEYLLHTADYDQINNEISADDGVSGEKQQQEIAISAEIMGNILANAVLANILVDFEMESRWALYVGGGVGLATVRVDAGTYLARNHDPKYITTEGLTEEQKTRLAGTTTILDFRARDEGLIWQGVGGVNYALSDQSILSFELRYVQMPAFKSEQEYLQLRSHESRHEPGGTVVKNRYEIESMSSVGGSIGLKFYF